ncbi:MAG: SpoIIIAH-like family protein [Clostridia bacterium]|nr:SpoIIIAH-like family protein [Clostridia bacterium]
MKLKGFKMTKKGIVALSLLLVLLAGAIWLNIRLNREDAEAKNDADAQKQDAVKTNTPDDAEAQRTGADVYAGYFANFRDERNLVRSQEIDYLRMIIDDSTTDAETLQNAQERLMELVSNMEQEFSIESQIRAKGFTDAAVTFRADSITVVIDGENLTDEEVARILDIVRSETGAPASAVRISLSRSGA